MTAFNLDDLAPAATAADVDAERDRRNVLDFVFDGVVYQANPESRRRISDAQASAQAAITAGRGAADNLNWPITGDMFVWIALDNTRHPMDAPTVLRFGETVVAREGVLILKGNDLKQLIASGERVLNVRDDRYW